MALQSGLQTITIHMLPNILKSKGNQKMTFGQLIEYNKRKTLLHKSFKKRGKKTCS